jgi:hypothetical protein
LIVAKGREMRGRAQAAPVTSTAATPLVTAGQVLVAPVMEVRPGEARAMAALVPPDLGNLDFAMTAARVPADRVTLTHVAIGPVMAGQPAGVRDTEARATARPVAVRPVAARVVAAGRVETRRVTAAPARPDLVTTAEPDRAAHRAPDRDQPDGTTPALTATGPGAE